MPEFRQALLTHPQGAEPRRLLTVTELRQQLERIERHGGGDWELDLSPDSDVPTTSSGHDDLAFDIRRYGITSATALGDGSQNFVLLKFGPAPLNGN